MTDRRVWTQAMDDELRRLRLDWPGQTAAARIIGVDHRVMQHRVKELGLPRLKTGPKKIVREQT